MTDTEAFEKIDEAIEDFKISEGLHKRIKVSKKSNTGWLVFKWRQISWTYNDVHNIIEIYPTFDSSENISAWNYYVAAYYDQDKKRYYLKQSFVANKPLDFIANNAGRLISEGYKFLVGLNKEQIPLAVELH